MINGNDLSLGKDWHTADSAKLVTGPDWARWELHWNDGARLYGVEDSKAEALEQLRLYGFGPVSKTQPDQASQPGNPQAGDRQPTEVQDASNSISSQEDNSTPPTTCSQNQPPSRVRLVLDVEFPPSEKSAQHLAALLQIEFRRCITQGLFTGIKQGEFTLRATERPEPVSELDLIAFIEHRMENGSISALDLPILMARYGLSEPDAFVDEMRERMEHLEWPSAEGDTSNSEADRPRQQG